MHEIVVMIATTSGSNDSSEVTVMTMVCSLSLQRVPASLLAILASPASPASLASLPHSSLPFLTPTKIIASFSWQIVVTQDWGLEYGAT